MGAAGGWVTRLVVSGCLVHPGAVSLLILLPGKFLLIQIIEAIDDFLDLCIAFGMLPIERTKKPIGPFRPLAPLLPQGNGLGIVAEVAGEPSLRKVEFDPQETELGAGQMRAAH